MVPASGSMCIATWINAKQSLVVKKNTKLWLLPISRINVGHHRTWTNKASMQFSGKTECFTAYKSIKTKTTIQTETANILQFSMKSILPPSPAHNAGKDFARKHIIVCIEFDWMACQQQQRPFQPSRCVYIASHKYTRRKTRASTHIYSAKALDERWELLITKPREHKWNANRWNGARWTWTSTEERGDTGMEEIYSRFLSFSFAFRRAGKK